MLKILLWLLILVGVLLAWRLAARPRRAAPEATPPPLQQRMVRCAECSLHLPEVEALAADGLHFCDEAHRAAYRGRSAGN